MRIFFNVVALCFFGFGWVNAQFVDDFSDGDFTQNPEWIGNVNDFTITPQFQLQSNGPTGTTVIYLSTASTVLNDVQWEFFANPRVATSANNLMDIYIISDVSDLNAASVNGYFVRIGGTPDEVALFRRSGSTETRIIQGVQGAIGGSSNNPTKVKVIRSAAGLFELFADYTGVGNQYELVGTVTDLTHTATAWFGLRVRYSSANFNRYNFDDVYVGPVIVDNTPPVLLEAKPLNANQLEVTFNEAVELSTSQNMAFYSVNNGVGQPIAAQRNNPDVSKVTLTFANDFPQGTPLTLSVSQVQDIAGNAMLPASIDFVYVVFKPYDIVINELMVNPTPVVLQLPDVEYIELKNRTPFNADLTGWKVRVGNTVRTLPACQIPADSFLVLTTTAGAAAYVGQINVAGITSFTTLSNTGQTVSLLNPEDVLISTVSYTDNWYGSTAKKNGGWSLEQKDPNNPCAGESNWTASINPNGGTPGRTNSVNQPLPDTKPPTVSRVSVITPDTILVIFSETVTLATKTNPASYLISHGIGQPTDVITFFPQYNRVKLALASPLQQGIIYTIAISNELLDCVGNAFENNTQARFAIPEPASANDLVINELLSNPATGCFDFVELYNRSNKVIDLRTLQIGNFDFSLNQATNLRTITADGFLIFPQDYVVLSANINAVRNCYFTSNPEAFLNVSPFPAYNNDEGTCSILRTDNEEVIDKMFYDKDSHLALIDNRKGISLERVNFDRPSADRTNWSSASADVGFATPAYRNSQFTPLGASPMGAITVTPEAFSPDGDGFDDIAAINYTLEAPGFIGSIYIYDANGRLVRTIVRSALLGSEGTYFWDGITDDRQKAKVGIYIVLLDAFTPDGKIAQVKKVCVVASRLNN